MANLPETKRGTRLTCTVAKMWSRLWLKVNQTKDWFGSLINLMWYWSIFLLDRSYLFRHHEMQWKFAQKEQEKFHFGINLSNNWISLLYHFGFIADWNLQKSIMAHCGSIFHFFFLSIFVQTGRFASNFAASNCGIIIPNEMGLVNAKINLSVIKIQLYCVGSSRHDSCMYIHAYKKRANQAQAKIWGIYLLILLLFLYTSF